MRQPAGAGPSAAYTARIDGGSSVITLAGAQFGPPAAGAYSWNVVYTQIRPDNTRLLFFQDPEIWEFLTSDSYVSIFGDAQGVFNSDRTDLTAWGDFKFCSVREDDPYPECAVPEIVCRSDHHKLTLTRQ